ncbi:hypothetical protein AB4Z48_26520 [Cupriavidus sp. 2TAF22]|uniref:hypothetical protein n=1 Tax=unclassified Cupriavidus TaxID=2640874 RepID=UPI003F917552
MKRNRKHLFAEGMPFRLTKRPTAASPRPQRTYPPTRLGRVASVALAAVLTPETWFVVALALSASMAHAREPTATDKAFCDRYALIMQQALTVDRSGDPAAIARFRQTVIRDPQAYLIMPGLGVSLTTPPWITDVTEQSREHCLDEVRLNMRGYLPNDPDRPSPGNTADNHVKTIAVLPSEREAAATTPAAPPVGDEFEGSFKSQMGSDIPVSFKRHAAVCFGGTLVTVPRRGTTPLQTCGVREQPRAYVVRFPRDSFGEVSVPFSTMRPSKVDQAPK